MYFNRIKINNFRINKINIYNNFEKSISETIPHAKNLYKILLNTKKIWTNNKILTSNIISIKITNSNIIFSILDSKNHTLRKISSGNMGFKGSQKTKKFALISILKLVIRTFKIYNRKSVSVQFKGLKRYHRLIIKKLKEKFFINSVKHIFLNPHNGCRLKNKINKKLNNEMTEWFKVIDCKSVRFILSWFESYSLQN